MNYRLLDEQNGRRTYAVAFETGDQVVSTLTELAKELSLSGSSVSGIGGFQHVTLGYFDAESKGFKENIVDEQVELLSIQGNIAERPDGSPKFHAHVVLGRFDGTTRGGHLIEAVVRPTLEAIITESPQHLCMRHDDDTGLVLLKP